MVIYLFNKYKDKKDFQYIDKVLETVHRILNNLDPPPNPPQSTILKIILEKENEKYEIRIA
jgi:hypothetical protein